MREARVPDDAFEVGDVGERVQVIGLAEPLLPEVHEARRAQGAGQSVHGLSPPAIQEFLRTCE